MTGLLTGLDWLSEAVQDPVLRSAVTVAAAAILVATLLSYSRLQRWLSDRMRPLYSDIVSTALLVGVCLFSLAVVVGVWGQTGQLRTLYAQQGLGGQAIARGIVTFILLVATYIVTRFLHRVLDEVLGSATAVTDHQVEVTDRLTQVIVWAVALVVILGVWIDDLGGLLVGAGVLGVVLGMAAQQVLGTILAGFVLMFARPFEIGDWIEVEDEEGIVTDISIANTRIQSFDGEYIMVPNDVIASSTVTNRSRRGRLRIEVDVGVDYGTDVERAADLAEATVTELDHSINAPSPQVVTKGFSDSAVTLGVRFWIDKPSARRRWRARTAAVNAIKEAFADEGVKIPYPQRELSGRPEAGGLRVADPDDEIDGGPGDGPDGGVRSGDGEREEPPMSRSEDD